MDDEDEGNQGDGKIKSSEGLYNDQIDKVMSRYKDFKGTIMHNEIKNILPDIKPHSRVAFIINSDPSTKEGKHWQCVYIDARDGPESSNSIEWYDSFGNPMPKDLLHDIKLIVKCLKPTNLLKFKENSIVHQSDDSSNCGMFCMKFLVDRFRNKSFAEATNYNDKVRISHATHDEKEIERLKQMKPFSYIY